MIRWLLLLALLIAAAPAHAATCFWVGGTATWTNANTASWASGTGGTGGTCAATGGVPKNAGDIATFDGSSGAGTVTNNVDVSIGTINCGAFTGTLDFATNNHNVTLTTQFNCSGTGTRTLNLGNGTWTINSSNTVPWTIATTTGLTFNKNGSTIAITTTAATSASFNGGGLSYNVVTFAGSGATRTVAFVGSNTFATLSITSPLAVTFAGTSTTTITNAFTWTGTVNSPLGLMSSQPGANVATISVATGSPSISGAGISWITFNGGATFAATSSLDLGGNSGITITPPSTGGGGVFIGGG